MDVLSGLLVLSLGVLVVVPECPGSFEIKGLPNI